MTELSAILYLQNFKVFQHFIHFFVSTYWIIALTKDINNLSYSFNNNFQRLVTFNDVAELQSNNQRLLALVRELTTKQEEAEAFDPSAIAKLKMEIDALRDQQADSLEQLGRQNKMMEMVINQREMYKNLYKQAMKGCGENVPMELERVFESSGSVGGKVSREKR